MEGFEWVAEMRNGISRPAKEARADLSASRSELGAVDAAMRRQESRRWGPLAPGGDLLQGLGARLMAALGPVALLVAALSVLKSLIEGAAAAAYHFVIEGSKMAILAAETREHMIRAFTGGAEGDEKVGQGTYDMVQRLRRELPQSEREIASWTSALQGVGLVDPGKIANVEKALASASALYGGGATGEAAAGKIKALIEKALEQDAFKTRGGLKAFAGTGISGDDLSKALGMSPGQLNKALTKGTISVDKGMDAITDILTRKGANALEGTLKEWDVIMSKGKESVSHLFEDVDSSAFMAMLADTGGMLDENEVQGRALKQIFTDIFGETFKGGVSILDELRTGFTWLEVYALRGEKALKPWKPALEAIGSVILYEIVTPFYVLLNTLSMIEKALAPVATAFANLYTLSGGPAIQMPAQTITAPAHATGGMVAKPAAGEFFASVAPGETIVPADQSRAASAPQLSRDEGGAASHLEQNVQLHYHGVKDAEETRHITTDELADLLERAAAEIGR